MSARPDSASVAAVRGQWGEDVAAETLRRDGYEIIVRNDHPVANDERLELDIVAYDPRTDTIVFVEVKQSAARSPYQRRLRRINRRKRENLLRACTAWRRVNKWHGSYRFDVIEVYGVPGRRPEVDHITHVQLFTRRERFVRWG